MNNQTKLKCSICPRECRLAENQTGFCANRRNINGEIKLINYGYTTGLAIDPVEKKPLYHFYPNSKVLSFGTTGCIMGCQFCQNWTTTKRHINNLPYISPEIIVKTALQYNCPSVAFTYNDPIAFYEYTLDTAILCRQNGIKTIAVTSGYINPEPRKELFKYIDAANIDLKGFSEGFYKKHCLAHLEPVLDTLNYVKNYTDCHLEVTTLLIEGENDDDKMLKDECEWLIENLGADVPLHFSAFHPDYKYLDRNNTSLKTLIKAYDIAKESGLNNVYTGNIINLETSTTYCKNCHKELIIRNGYNILQNSLINGECPECHTKCFGAFN